MLSVIAQYSSQYIHKTLVIKSYTLKSKNIILKKACLSLSVVREYLFIQHRRQYLSLNLDIDGTCLLITIKHSCPIMM